MDFGIVLRKWMKSVISPMQRTWATVIAGSLTVK
jgi:hypothetical protein